MRVGIPREVKNNEYRVAITPHDGRVYFDERMATP